MRFVHTFFAFITILIFTACSGTISDNQSTTTPENEAFATPYAAAVSDHSVQQPQKNNSQTNGSTTHTFTDKESGMVSFLFPAPENWKVNKNAEKNQPIMTGPHNLKIYESEPHIYSYPTNPMMQEAYRQYGQPINQPIRLNGVIQHDLKPRLEKDGMKFINQNALAAVTQNQVKYINQLYAFQSSRVNLNIEGTEWIDGEGNPLFVVVYYMESHDPQSQSITWMYSYDFLTANADYFEEAKSTYIYAIENQEAHPNYVAYQNQKSFEIKQQTDRKIQQSWAEHNQRMRSNQAAFDARQKLHKETYDAVNQASWDAYNSRNTSMDRSHNATINSIYEQQNVTNPTNGQTYQVEGYYNQYWMNNNGEYIGSDNSLYNPNQNPDYMDQEWEEAIPNPYGE